MATKRTTEEPPEQRKFRGRSSAGALFPASAAAADLPADDAEALGEIKRRIEEERLRVVLAANATLVVLYWDIGRRILERQERAGWGAKVVDRLAADLRRAFPEMRGFSPRNLKYMRAFAAAWPERAFVQQLAAQIPWFHNCLLLDKVHDQPTRVWYARQTVAQGWSRNVLALQIASRGFTIEAAPMRLRGGLELRRVTKLTGEDAVSLDLLLLREALQPIWDSRRRLESDRGSLWVVSREGLIAMKAAAGRDQDLADIRRLEDLDG